MDKLFWIEGLPGTGKTSVAEKLKTHFENKGYIVHCLMEENPQIPTDFCHIAALPKVVYEEMILTNNNIGKLAMCVDDFCFIHIDSAPKKMQEELYKYDIGDEFNSNFDAQKYIVQGLRRIKGSLENLNELEGIVIIDSGFLQNPLNEVFYRHGTDEQAKLYILGIVKLMVNYDCMCIYLDRGNADTSINFAKKVKGDLWYQRVIEIQNMTESRNHFSRRYKIEKEIVEKNIMNTSVCRINKNDWSEADLLISRL